MDLRLLDPNIVKTSVHHTVYIGEVLGYFHWPTDFPFPRCMLALKSFWKAQKIAAVRTDYS